MSDAGTGGETVVLSPTAIGVVEALLTRLLSGERVAVLAEDQELSPTDAPAILGISRPLVVHRMDLGDLPFRYAGKHRRASLTNITLTNSVLRRSVFALAANISDGAKEA